MRKNKFFITLLTLLTSIIHVYFFAIGDKHFVLYWAFLANALGYFFLLFLYWVSVDGFYRDIRYMFAGYTLLTIILYIIISASTGIWSIPLGPLTKLDELVLIGLLLTDN